jgi:hypothetical protein
LPDPEGQAIDELKRRMAELEAQVCALAGEAMSEVSSSGRSSI